MNDIVNVWALLVIGHARTVKVSMIVTFSVEKVEYLTLTTPHDSQNA